MKKLIPSILIVFLTACNPTTEKKVTIGFSAPPPSSSPYREILLGEWLQPIAGQQKEKQGFILRNNGTVASVNIHTLQYDGWDVSADTLFLRYHVAGVKLASKGIDTLVIKELEESEVVLSPIGANVSDTEFYHKEN